MCWSFGVIIVCSLVLHAGNILWLNPRKLRRKLSEQGITGPPPRFYQGSIAEMRSIATRCKPEPLPRGQVSHGWARSIFPYLHHWALRYGSLYMYSTRQQVNLCVNRPDLVKFLNLQRPLDLDKPSTLVKTPNPLFGKGIMRATGQNWASQRKLIAPQFFLDKVKGMMDLMVDSTMAMIEKWEGMILQSEETAADIYITEDVNSLSANVIARACFSSSYAEGRQIFAKLRTLQHALARPDRLFGFHNLRFLPSKANKDLLRIREEVDLLILKRVRARQEENQKALKPEKDLLQMILESADANGAMNEKACDSFVVDSCKNIYFAGHETTATTISWSLMLLAVHPEWQDRIRSEILEFCGDRLCHRGSLDYEMLRKLKVLTMVIQETLRLYGPAIILVRETMTGIKLGEIDVPKGVVLWTSIPALHRDPENWGPDALEFKPERFKDGVSEACKHPQAYVPFGYGSRLCLGQTFAMLEMKIVLALILSRFSFLLSPEYQHSPVFRMVLAPEHGMRLVVRKI
ncbi:cytochrome P450 714A1-like [Rhodamnia argentea]|uniref:Cytochrome P450 714A1-like n=1 Tax=Rhodamnia argentea TaxID=178133 RepID=A0A8B8QHQ7_9MYRT|nr:cytochrome P450 714A1-like [Rhodamnia argentea]